MINYYTYSSYCQVNCGSCFALSGLYASLSLGYYLTQSKSYTNDSMHWTFVKLLKINTFENEFCSEFSLCVFIFFLLDQLWTKLCKSIFSIPIFLLTTPSLSSQHPPPPPFFSLGNLMLHQLR